MPKRPVSFWIMIGVAVFLCVFLSVYAALKLFSNGKESLTPTVILTLTNVQPANTLLPTTTRVVATIIPGLTSVSQTVIPSSTPVPPTAKASATSQPPTINPSATSVPPTTVPPSATSLPPTAIPTINPIQNIVWQWLTVTADSTGIQTNIPNPGNYTISFYPDGALSGVADCNAFDGTYSQANGFTIRIGASTSTFCGEGSLDQEYLQLLNNVVSAGPDGLGNLALETVGGAQRMLFVNGGTSVKP